MKKILYTLVLLCGYLSASATNVVLPQSGKTMKLEKNLILTDARAANKENIRMRETPSGTLRHYSQASYVTGSIGMAYTSGLSNSMIFDADGSTVYLNTLFPTVLKDLWMKGRIEGGDIVFDHNEVATQVDYYGMQLDYHLGELTLNEYNEIVDVKDVVLKSDGKKYMIEDDIDDPTRFIGLYMDWTGEGDYSILTYTCAISLEEIEIGEKVAVPEKEGLVVKDYIYYATDRYKDPQPMRGTVTIDGDDYYFDKFTSSGGIVKGTRNGDQIVINSFQYIGDDSGYYLFYTCLETEFKANPDGSMDADVVDLVLNIGEDGKTFTVDSSRSLVSCLLKTTYEIYDYSFTKSLEEYEGDVPAVPRAPFDPYFTTKDYKTTGQNFFMFCVSNVDVNDRYINPDNLGYQILMDGKVFELTPEIFRHIKENMTVVPYGFQDVPPLGYDIIFGAGVARFYIAYDDFKTIGARTVYTVDGVTNYSDTITLNRNGKIIDGINSVTVSEPVSDTPVYDLYGRRAAPNQKGILVRNGVKILQR